MIIKLYGILGLKKIGCYDIEHQELRELCKFDEFIADMSSQLETLF